MYFCCVNYILERISSDNGAFSRKSREMQEDNEK